MACLWFPTTGSRTERGSVTAHTVCADYTGALRFRGKVGSLTRPVETFEGFPSENSKTKFKKKNAKRNTITITEKKIIKQEAKSYENKKRLKTEIKNLLLKPVHSLNLLSCNSMTI